MPLRHSRSVLLFQLQLTTSCVRVLFNCIWKLCANQFCANPVDALRASEFKIAVYCKLDYEVANLAPS